MSTEESRRFNVEVMEITDNPTASPDGLLKRSVRFRVAPADQRAAFEVDGGLAQGETLTRSIQLKEKGGVTVQMPAEWQASEDSDWKQQIVDAALDRAVSEGA